MATDPTSAASSNSASAIYSAINATQSSVGSASKTSTTSDTQDRFLKLLTTQLKNQDPLNPMDNAQMTSQLAQISTVDGITKLNATLTKLIDGQTQSQSVQAAALVGHGVLVPGNGMDLGSGGAIGGYDLAGAADAVNVTIKDANGLAVRTLQLGAQKAGSQGFTWDGKTDAGTAAATGAYTFAVSAVQGNDDVTANALTYGKVDSVVRGATGLTVNVGSLGGADMGTFVLDDIKQIL